MPVQDNAIAAPVEYWRWTEHTWRAKRDWRSASLVSCGIDIGSVGSKAVVMTDGEIYAYSSIRTGSNSPESAVSALQAALQGTGMTLDDIGYVVGTGYGRINVPFAQKTLTEIACHARGANYMNPAIRTILDMGGQDCKAIQCDERGKVLQFVMNDKCAAGTGRGMEVLADLLAVPVIDVGRMSLDLGKEEPPPVSSTCVVFAKTEAVGLMREGWSKNHVIAAYCSAMAQRVYSLIQRVGVAKEFAITGGIAKNIGVVSRIEQKLGVYSVRLQPDPQITGALGAAVFARDLLDKQRRAAAL